MASKVADTFVEATTTTALQSHTPTGADAGSGWTMVAGAVNVVTGSNFAQDNNGSNGNRATMSPALDSDEMDVSLDISMGAGTYQGPGPTARAASAGAGVFPEYESYYNVSAGQWYLADSVGFDALTEAYPGGTVTLKLQVRSGDVRLFANGTQKCSLSTNRSPGSKYAGMMLLNFDGAGGAVRGDNFLAVSMERHQTRHMISAGGFF